MHVRIYVNTLFFKIKYVSRIFLASYASGRMHVTLNVYSGRPDPTWTVDVAHPEYPSVMHLLQTVASRPLRTGMYIH